MNESLKLTREQHQAIKELVKEFYDRAELESHIRMVHFICQDLFSVDTEQSKTCLLRLHEKMQSREDLDHKLPQLFSDSPVGKSNPTMTARLGKSQQRAFRRSQQVLESAFESNFRSLPEIQKQILNELAKDGYPIELMANHLFIARASFRELFSGKVQRIKDQLIKMSKRRALSEEKELTLEAQVQLQQAQARIAELEKENNQLKQALENTQQELNTYQELQPRVEALWADIGALAKSKEKESK